MKLGLEGKTALITGASRGIGLAIAEGFLTEGCNVQLVARDPKALADAQSHLSSVHSLSVETLALDLREPGAMLKVAQNFGTPDILVNNAGDIPHGGLLDIDAPRWRTAWDLKVYGYIDLSREIYKGMKSRGSGVILNVIGAAGGEVVVPEYIAGSAGNAALHAFTRALGASSPADGIRVAGVHPGMVETDRQRVRWQQRAKDKLGDAERWRELTADMPFGRLALPSEVANALVFLASDAAAYISGITLTVDGGLSQRRSITAR
jgi:3-oxoacyl-[acyl-carrier protein] reductase